MLYLDTSALLKLYVREADSEKVHARVVSQDFPLPVWEIQEMEFINALHLKAFWKEITHEEACTQIELFHGRQKRGLYVFPKIHRSDLMNTFRKLSEKTPSLGCRTMDVLHVACALEVGATEFLTFDQRQAGLAAMAGLRGW